MENVTEKARELVERFENLFRKEEPEYCKKQLWQGVLKKDCKLAPVSARNYFCSKCCRRIIYDRLPR
jgi:hypothetical protein